MKTTRQTASPSLLQKFTGKDCVAVFVLVIHAFIIIHSDSAWSQNYERYCFPTAKSAEVALMKLDFLKTSVDRIQLDENCLDLLIPEYRSDLYRKFISIRMPEAQREFTQDLHPKECHFNVSVKKIEKNQNTNFSSDLSANNSQGMNLNSEQQYALSVQEKKQGSLEINGYILNLVCEKQGEWYSVKINSQQRVNEIDRFKQPDKNLVLISTELLIQPGQSVQIGSISSDNNKDAHKVQNASGAVFLTDVENSHLIFLQLK